MKYTRKAGTLNLSVEITFLDSTTGAPEEGVNAATLGLEIWYQREGAARVVLASVNDLAALTDAHNDEGILHKANGRYRLDLPDAAIDAGVPACYFGGSATGMVAMGGMIEMTANDLGSAEVQAACQNALVTPLAEGYAAKGATASVRDMLYEKKAHLTEFSKSGNILTIYELDGVTPIATFTMDDANQPTTLHRLT